ncbi:MAG: HypC/HybG/HupF family hydrogenase formation chaperone [Bacteroidales bacterium]
MCISIPAKIISIQENMAKVSMEGNEYSVGIQMLDDVKVGDYVLIHTGFAIQKISEQEAKETLKIIEEMKGL